MHVSEAEFRNALSRFATGVSVVTTKDNAGRFYGITVSAFCSVSLFPPLVLICIEKSTASHFAFIQSEAFVVNILSASQVVLSERFAAPAPDKFDNVRYTPGVEGIPVLHGALANIQCRLTAHHDAGDHSIFVGEVEECTVNEGDPLLYFRSQYDSIRR